MKPTKEQFNALQGAYDYFNRTLFGSELKPCILNFSRKSKSFGFFDPQRWGERKKQSGHLSQEKMDVHEISLNPESLLRQPKETFGTLVHEMCHLWQFDFGEYSKNGYHNSEWAFKMKSVGLIPSDTGAPGGKETGSKMTHFIEKNGKFERSFKLMPDKLLLPFLCIAEVKKESKKNKVKYTCIGCETNVWGKAGLSIECTDCEMEFQEN